MTTKTTDRLLTAKELAGELRRGYSYVLAMRARGFPMPGGTATLEEARDWLAGNPKPRGAQHARKATWRRP